MINTALQSKWIERVIWSTDDTEIEQVGVSFGAEVIRLPKEISEDYSPSEEAFTHVLERLKNLRQPLFLS